MQRVKTTRILLIVSIVFFLFAQYVYIPFQTPYLKDGLGVVPLFIGIIVGAYGLTQTILRFPLGIFADRYNRHKVFILAGLVSSGLASVLRLLVPTPGAFLVANMLSGIAAAMWISFMVFYASLYPEDEMKKAMGYSNSASYVGILLAFVAGSLLNDIWGIRVLFAASIISGALGTFVALFIREAKPAPCTAPPISPLRVIASKPLILWSLLGASMQAILLSTALSFTTSYLKQYTSQELLLGVSAAVYIAASVVASFFAGYLKRMSSRALLSIFFGFLLVYCILLPLTHTVWQVCLLQAVAGIGSGGLTALLMAYALQGVDPRAKSTAMGFYQAVYGVGMTLGPMMTGALIDVSGYSAGFWALALLALLSIAAALLINPHGRIHFSGK